MGKQELGYGEGHGKQARGPAPEAWLCWHVAGTPLVARNSVAPWALAVPVYHTHASASDTRAS